MSTLTSVLVPLLSGLTGAIVSYALARLAARPATPDRSGWRHVRPGPMHWTGCILAGGLVGLMGYIGLFVGSSRPDAEFQMQVMYGLLVAFAIGGAACTWQMRLIARRAVSFRGKQIAFCDDRRQRVVRHFAEIAEMRNSWLYGITIRFSNGTSLRLDPNAVASADLCERIMSEGQQ
jgi:hypothetical protein